MIDSYLTERKLGVALRELFPEKWVGGQVKLPGSRRRFDMAYQDNGVTVLVEYDGDEHYRNSLKIKADREKDQLAQEAGMHLVRVPYWVQLDHAMARHWFGVDAEIIQTFPHGFVTTKIFPASFCELGIERFIQELSLLPIGVRDAVVESLKEKTEEHEIEYVLSTGLRALLDA